MVVAPEALLDLDFFAVWSRLEFRFPAKNEKWCVSGKHIEVEGPSSYQA